MTVSVSLWWVCACVRVCVCMCVCVRARASFIMSVYVCGARDRIPWYFRQLQPCTRAFQLQLYLPVYSIFNT